MDCLQAALSANLAAIVIRSCRARHLHISPTISNVLEFRKMKKALVTFTSRVTLILVLLVGTIPVVPAQSFSGLDKERVKGMLNVIKGDLKKNYYDATFRGIDIDARFKEAEQKISASDSLGQGYGVIAQVLSEFNDSHLYFLPPARPARADYGWQMMMIRDEAYIYAIRPGSDAESKGLKLGDRVLKVDGFAPTRDNMWKMMYRYHTLRPQAGIKVVVQTGDEQPRELDLKAKIIQGKRLLTYDFTGQGSVDDIEFVLRNSDKLDHHNRHRYIESENAFIWKMPQFDLADEQVDDLMNKAEKRKALLLDLRGNPGGAIKTLQRMIGNLFDHDVKIADIKRRKETKPLIAKTRGSGFSGKLVVLIDSKSASCSELLARIVQLEKRGTVIGDRSAGAVMIARGYSYEMGGDSVISYGATITDADAIMTDGKSLEHVGVTPDESSLPSGAELAAKRDPVLSKAAALVGVELSAEKAGTLFPIEWLTLTSRALSIYKPVFLAIAMQ
jgi:C-terminal processing protease CtpA/Prc